MVNSDDINNHLLLTFGEDVLMVFKDGIVLEKATYSSNEEIHVPKYSGHITTTSCLETGIVFRKFFTRKHTDKQR